MKYQIYLAKDVSEVINAISQGLGKKPNTLIKELLEDNFRRGLIQATQQGALSNDQRTTKKQL